MLAPRHPGPSPCTLQAPVVVAGGWLHHRYERLAAWRAQISAISMRRWMANVCLARDGTRNLPLIVPPPAAWPTRAHHVEPAAHPGQTSVWRSDDTFPSPPRQAKLGSCLLYTSPSPRD